MTETKVSALVRTSRNEDGIGCVTLDIVGMKTDQEVMIIAEMIKLWLESSGAVMGEIT